VINTALGNLGEVLLQQGRAWQAIPFLQQSFALAAARKADEAQAAAANNLSLAYQAQGDSPRALEYLRVASNSKRRLLGDDHPSLALSLNNLGLALLEEGDAASAQRQFEEALAIHRRGGHPDAATSLTNLAWARRQQGDLTGARQYLEEALAIRNRALGEDHPETAASLSNLAWVLGELGDVRSAWQLQHEALATRLRALGPDHLETAFSRSSLAWVLSEMRDVGGAIQHLELALATYRRALGEHHPRTAATWYRIGECLLEAGLSEEALARYRQAEEGFAAAGDERLCAHALARQGEILARDSKLPEAERTLRQAAEIYDRLGERSRARSTFLRVADLLAGALGADHERARAAREKAEAMK
jgi:tetratricopeptide (TPR) repeat protein